jgi:prephenate dehydrogenase
MDIGSTKREILQAMSALPKNFDPIGGHPICGKEKLGLENADASLYHNAPFVVTSLARTTQRAKSAIRQIISALSAKYIEMSAEDHDRILASTSHLPFLLASSLVDSTPHEYSSLIGTGFRSTSRLAGTPSQMMMGVLKSNRDNILHSIYQFRSSLHEIESALQNEDYLQLEAILNKSRNSYLLFVSRHSSVSC